jgi:hypothetical protein
MLQLLRGNVAILRIVSGLSLNFAAALIFLAIVAPGFIPPKDQNEMFTLTVYIVFGIVFIIIAYLCEKKIK